MPDLKSIFPDCPVCPLCGECMLLYGRAEQSLTMSYKLRGEEVHAASRCIPCGYTVVVLSRDPWASQFKTPGNPWWDSLSDAEREALGGPADPPGVGVVVRFPPEAVDNSGTPGVSQAVDNSGPRKRGSKPNPPKGGCETPGIPTPAVNNPNPGGCQQPVDNWDLGIG